MPYPALIGFYYSFHNKMLGFPKFEFVGLENYTSILGNPTVLMSYVRAFIFSVTSVAIKLPLGLAVALLLNQSCTRARSDAGYCAFTVGAAA